MADFLHGIEHVNVASDVVPVNDIVTAVIGLVGTADKGDTNVLTLCKSAADDAAFGTQGTIPEALKAIRMQDSTAGSALVFVVKVKDATAEITGADIVGTDELMQQIQAGEFNFDAAVATPDQMGKVGRLGKILGPRGLMPNPKLGTVTNDVAKAIKELKGGRVEYRADRYGIAHVVLGKVSFTPEQLAENYGAVYDEILRMKPAAAKGKYVKSITVSGTMTPGVSVDSSVTRAYTESAE